LRKYIHREFDVLKNDAAIKLILIYFFVNDLAVGVFVETQCKTVILLGGVQNMGSAIILHSAKQFWCCVPHKIFRWSICVRIM